MYIHIYLSLSLYMYIYTYTSLSLYIYMRVATAVNSVRLKNPTHYRTTSLVVVYLSLACGRTYYAYLHVSHILTGIIQITLNLHVLCIITGGWV